VVDALRPGQSMTFGGGNVELRPSRRGQEVVLAFEFPREVKIMREELT
jgi:sRNA-binding carbon storage regulator CsrA